MFQGRFVVSVLAALLAFSNVPPQAVRADASVTRATLPNGLRVVIVSDPLAPVVTVETNYLAGGNDTPPGFPGMAHAEEHMGASRSLHDVTSDQLATITTLLGGDFNADTQETVTQYYVSAPATSLDVALHIEAARMTNVLNLQSEWAQERGAIEQEVSRDNSQAFYRFYAKARAALFAGTPYAHTPLGTRASFNATTGAQLKKFYDSWYAPNNAILVIAGDVDAPAALEAVKSILGPVPRRAVSAHANSRLQPLTKMAPIRDDSDYPVPFVLLAYRMPGYRDKDYAAAEIASDVLSSERGSLAALGYDGKALGAGFQYTPFPTTGLAFGYIVIAPNGDTSAADGLLSSTIAGSLKSGVSADLVEAAKRREIAQALYSRNAIDGLAEDWSEALAVQGLASPDDILDRFKAVTVDDVNRVIRTYLVRDKAVLGVLTPKPGSIPSGGGGFAVKDSFSSPNAKPVPLPPWAAQLSVVPPVPASRLSPSDERLPNGMRLIVQPEAIAQTVTLRGEIDMRPVLQEPAGQEGVAGLLDGLFNYGTATYDRIAFQKELDAIAADVTAGSSFGLDAPAPVFDRGVALLADVLLHPALPSSAFTIVQSQSVQGLTGAIKTPNYLARRALDTALLPKGDPALREATPAGLAKLTLDDARAYYRTAFRPDMTTIVVSGAVTPAQARAVVEKYFGSWTASGPPPVVVLPPVPANAAATVNVNAPGRTQVDVVLAEQLPGFNRLNADYDALTVGDAILGGGFYATRFSRDLRKDAGLVYTIGAGVTAGKSRGEYRVNFGADPDKVAKARAIIDRDLTALATAPPSEGELSQAKVQLLRDLSLSEASIDAITSGLLGRAVAGLPLDEPTRRATAIRAMSAQSVTAAFKTWIDPNRFVQVNTGPAK
jgi:zinc protease